MKLGYSKQSINHNDVKIVSKTLLSKFITQGPKVIEFENNIKKYVGSRYAYATNSATSALHIACLSINLNKSDYILTSPISFVASSNCALYCGAKIKFIDIDINTFNLCPLKIIDYIKKKKKLGHQLPKAIIFVYLAGNPADLSTLYKVCKANKIYLIEDASHALGSIINKKKIGSCLSSDICVFSFHPVKNITTAEGGMVLTNNHILAKKLNIFRSHGITKDKNEFIDKANKSSSWYYEQKFLGYNYRMNDIEASLGISQLKRLNRFILKRNKIAKYYKNAFLENKNIRLQYVGKNCKSAYHLFVIILNENKNPKKFEKYMYQNNIILSKHYIPIYRQPYYKNLNFIPKSYKRFKNSEIYYKYAFSIPNFYDLDFKNVNKISKLINNF